MGWSIHQVPELSGKTIFITGANSGIGLEAAHVLASRGAHVIMACRSPKKGEGAKERLLRAHPEATVELVRLDLADLESVRTCAAEVSARHPRIDVLVNNAGVMALPFQKTVDGYEMQLATNHLGHFALTGLLMPSLLAADAPRVVTVSSIAHFWGWMKFDALHEEKKYSPWLSYGQSKLANLLFVKELARRVEDKGLEVLSVACHPGYANTNINRATAQLTGASFTERFMASANLYLAQSARMGALPTIFAATADGLDAGGFYGPEGILQLIGGPTRCRTNARAQDDEAAKRLWDLSVELTRVRYPELD